MHIAQRALHNGASGFLALMPCCNRENEEKKWGKERKRGKGKEEEEKDKLGKALRARLGLRGTAKCM